MQTKCVVAGLVAGAVLTAGATLASAHTTSYATASTYGYPTEGPKAALGHVNSGFGERACAKGRKVRLFERRRRGEDRLIGSVRTTPTGAWEIRAPLRSGRKYYATVKRKNIGPSGHRHICRAYTTSSLVYPSGTS